MLFVAVLPYCQPDPDPDRKADPELTANGSMNSCTQRVVRKFGRHHVRSPSSPRM